MSQLPLPAGTWQIDPSHTAVTFAVRHLMVSKVRGRFGSFSGTITIGDDLASSSVDASVDITSISTDDETRDAHLRSPDFFDVDAYPTLTFRSTRVEGSADGYRLVGDLTIKDVTREVELDLQFGGVDRDPWGNTKSGFEAKGTINRKDFGLVWNAPLESGGMILGDKVTIELDVEAALEAAAESAVA